jgi:hypothetical protein
MASHQRGWTLQIARIGFACLLIGAGCATGGNAQLDGPQVAATGEWRDCLRFSRAWEQASRLSPAPSLSAHTVSLVPTCLEAR